MKEKKNTSLLNTKEKKKKTSLLHAIWRARYIYLFIMPTFVYLAIFHYKPLYGIILAFKDYKPRLGIWGSPWVGLEHFERIFSNPMASTAILNTIEISLSRLIFEFPMAIIVALLLTEIRGKRLKKAYQTILTFPHFLSWIMISAIILNFFSGNGAINSILQDLGFDRINFLASKPLFRPLLYITANWKEVGWGSIIYLAAIASIDTTLYEAARVDGASRLQQIWHITLPGIRATIAVSFILATGGIMSAGFDQIFTLRNPIVQDAANVLDTYIYDITFSSTMPDYGFSTAVGLFKSSVGLIMMLIANKVAGWLTGTKLFS